MEILSAYNVNYKGVLCYSGHAVNSDTLTFDHHNGAPYRGERPMNYNYEVGAISQYHFIHGRPYRVFTVKI